MHDIHTGKIINSENVKVHPRMKELYKFFKHNGRLVDIENYNPHILNIFSRQVLQKIADGEEDWEDMIPEGVANIIKNEELFGYSKPVKVE